MLDRCPAVHDVRHEQVVDQNDKCLAKCEDRDDKAEFHGPGPLDLIFHFHPSLVAPQACVLPQYRHANKKDIDTVLVEVLLVQQADAITNEKAVLVHFHDAPVAKVTVVRSLGLQHFNSVW